MTADDKKTLVTNVMLAIFSGDLQAAEPHLADDIRWVMAPSLSGSHPPVTSKQQLLARAGGSKKMFPEGLKTDVINVFCDGDTVLVEFTNKGKVVNGKIYENEYVNIFVLNDEGKIREIREYQDSLRVHQTFLS